MNLVDFYQSILKPPYPWHVAKVEMEASQQRVDVWLEHARDYVFQCPVCEKPCPLHDHSEERVWRHLDTCECETFLHARLPRVSCKEHGVKTGEFGMAVSGGSLSDKMESRCIRLLEACTIKDAAEILAVSWDVLHGVEERAVARGLARRDTTFPVKLGIDEKQVFARHRYFTIVTDLKGGRVQDVMDKRGNEDIKPWFEEHAGQLAKVEKVAMDMSAGFASMASKYMPQADVCFDRFHLQQVIQKAVDDTRKAEQAELPEEKRRQMFGGRYLFLWKEKNLPERRKDEFEALKRIAVKTSRAWRIKEDFVSLWEACAGDRDKGREMFRKWFWWATHSRLKFVIAAAKTLKRHLDGLLNALESRITNAVTEGLNQKIEALKREACGYRNKDSFRTAILFRCAGLDMSPGRA